MTQKTIAEQQAKAVYIAPSIFASHQAVNGTNVPLVIEIGSPGATSPPMPRNTLTFVHWSYSDDPTNATLTITDGVVTETIYITTGGPGFLPFEGVAFAENAVVRFTLSPGGAGINSSLALIGVRNF